MTWYKVIGGGLMNLSFSLQSGASGFHVIQRDK